LGPVSQNFLQVRHVQKTNLFTICRGFWARSVRIKSQSEQIILAKKKMFLCAFKLFTFVNRDFQYYWICPTFAEHLKCQNSAFSCL
jgi:hypothetical protein